MLGQLGLTPSDTARLQALRRRAAARAIQRAVRAWLRRLRAARAVRAAAEQAARAAARLREHAALILQRHWRAREARALLARLRGEARERERAAAAARARAGCAAVRIQRAWRAHRKRRRAAQALSRGGAVAHPGAAAHRESEGQGTSSTELAAGQEVDERRRAAATRIQAAVRGWLVRRGQGLWWTRQLAGIRSRRAALRAWTAHCAYLDRARPLQQQVCGACSRRASAARAGKESVLLRLCLFLTDALGPGGST